MATEIIMPKLGMTMTEGTVVKWFKKENEPVKKGEPVCEISSEKLQNEVEAPADGILLKIVVQENETVPVAAPIGYIGQAGEQVDGTATTAPAEKSTETATVTAEKKAPSSPVSKDGRIRISPAARKLAQSLNIDIHTVKGTGPNGRITRADIEQAHKNQTASAATVAKKKEESEQLKAPQKKKMIGMRKAVAENMHKSIQETAQFTIMQKADVTELVELRKKIKEQTEDNEKVHITITHFIAKAVIKALQTHKMVNSTYENGEILVYDDVHLGIAVALDEGLIVPVLHQANKMSLTEIAKQVQTLSQKARKGELAETEIQGSTFTITNLGKSGAEYFTPVLNYPETGILGVATIQPTPVFTEDNQIVRRDMLPLSLTIDHRIVDGEPASQFLATIIQYLENPYSLLV